MARDVGHRTGSDARHRRRVTAVTSRRIAEAGPAGSVQRIELWEVERVGPWRARSAVQGVLDHQDAGDVLRLEQLEDVRVGLDVVLADPPAAEAARAHGRSLAVPAVQPSAA